MNSLMSVLQDPWGIRGVVFNIGVDIYIPHLVKLKPDAQERHHILGYGWI